MSQAQPTSIPTPTPAAGAAPTPAQPSGPAACGGAMALVLLAAGTAFTRRRRSS